jgi:PAS domain-containing protein
MYYFVPVWDSPEPGSDYVVRLVMFLLVGLLGCYVSSVCRRAVSALDGVHEVLEGTGIAVLFADQEKKVSFQNANARLLTEQTDLQALGKPLGRVVSLIDEKSRVPSELPLERVRREGKAVDLGDGLMIVSALGKEAPVVGALAPVRNSDNQPDGLALALRSVADQRKTENELRLRIRKLEASLADTQAELDEAVQGHEQHRAAKEQVEFSLAQTHDELERLRAEHANACEDISGKLRAAHADNQRHKQELEEANGRHRSLMQSHSELERRLAAERDQRERTEQRLAEKEAAHAQVQEWHQSTRADFEQRLSQSRRDQEQSEERLRAEAQDLRRQLGEHNQGWREKQQTEERLRAEIQELHRQLAEHRQARGQADEALRQTSASFERELEERIRSHAGAQEALRAEIARRQATEESLRAGHEHLEAVLGQHADPLFAFDNQGKTTVWNRALEKLSGLSAVEVIGQPIADVLGILGQPEANQWIAVTLTGKSSSVAFKPFPGTAPDQPSWQAELAPLLGSANEIKGGSASLRMLAVPLPAAPKARSPVLRRDPAQNRYRGSRLTQEEHHARWLSFN